MLSNCLELILLYIAVPSSGLRIQFVFAAIIAFTAILPLLPFLLPIHAITSLHSGATLRQEPLRVKTSPITAGVTTGVTPSGLIYKVVY